MWFIWQVICASTSNFFLLVDNVCIKMYSSPEHWNSTEYLMIWNSDVCYVFVYGGFTVSILDGFFFNTGTVGVPRQLVVTSDPSTITEIIIRAGLNLTLGKVFCSSPTCKAAWKYSVFVLASICSFKFIYKWWWFGNKCWSELCWWIFWFLFQLWNPW